MLNSRAIHGLNVIGLVASAQRHQPITTSRLARLLGLSISYTESLMKDLKQSTKQRFGAIDFDYPEAEVESEIIMHEISRELAGDRLRLGLVVRQSRRHQAAQADGRRAGRDQPLGEAGVEDVGGPALDLRHGLGRGVIEGHQVQVRPGRHFA